MTDQTIRPANAVLLIKLETTEGVDANPSATTDAVPFEADSVEYNSPYTSEQSTEATGSLVAGAPLIVGQPATFRFRSRIKGAGAGVTYTSSVKPPLHAALSACGKRAQFTAAVSAAALTAGSTTSGTLGTGFSSTAGQYLGMRLALTAGPGSGRSPLVAAYSAAKLATLADLMGASLDTSTQAGLPANWTYAGTSPRDAAARATDHPSATIYLYEDGTLLKFVGCRGTAGLEGQSARPGFGTFDFTGIYAGKTDAALPTNAVIAGHSAPILVQGAGPDYAALLNRKPLPISSWSLADGGQVETPDDPNTPQGFGAGIIADRAPILTLDPLMTLVATRDAMADLAAGTDMIAAIRCGGTSGNRWALTIPKGQIVGADPGRRGRLRSEQLRLQAKSPGLDAYTRDAEAILLFD